MYRGGFGGPPPILKEFLSREEISFLVRIDGGHPHFTLLKRNLGIGARELISLFKRNFFLPKEMVLGARLLTYFTLIYIARRAPIIWAAGPYNAG